MLAIHTNAWSSGRWQEPLAEHLDSPRTLALVFGAPEFIDAPAVFLELRRAFPRSVLHGCSTAGEICGARIFDGSLVLAIVRFESTRLEQATEVAADAFLSGRLLGERLLKPDLAGALVLSDGAGMNGSALTRGLREALGGLPVSGGLAGDGDRFQRTWVLGDGVPQTNLVSAVGFYGTDVRLSHGSRGGWDVFGPERFVTRSRGNVLFELDGKPALDLYRQYLGDRASGLPASALLFPLSLRETRDGPALVRTVLSVDESARSMTFAGELPEGSLAQLMRANFERLIQGASDASGLVARHQGPALSIAISCIGRRLVLKQRAEDELDAVVERLGESFQQIGFYSYGEITPHGDVGCELHNQTMTLTGISEL